MVQTIFISVAVTGAIALMNSIYKIGFLKGEIEAYKWMERELVKSRAMLIEQHKRDTRRSDELLADDNAGGAGSGESQATRKNI